MSFTRLVLFSLSVPTIVVLVFAGALAGGGRALAQGLADFFERDDALADAAVEMVAQGLQRELAVRNIVLAPSQTIAYQNHQKAGTAFDEALATAAAATTRQQVITRVREMSAALGAKQRHAMALAKQDAAAAADYLNQVETPAWRALRAELLELKKVAAAGKQTARRDAEQSIRAASIAALVAALACALGCAGNAWLLKRRIDRELGADPAVARRALSLVAAGDLHAEVEVRRGDTGSLMAAIEGMRQSLHGIVTQVGGISSAIATAAGEVAAGSADLSARTERQAGSLQQTAASIEEIASTVELNAGSAGEASRLAEDAHQVAQRGGAAVQAVVQTMGAITAQGVRVAEITAVIDSLAFQTNILALNASVESARAGEHGRGFAVVATEVRALAQRCAAAAREIKTLVADNAVQVEAGAHQASDAGRTMQEIVARVSGVSQLIREIAGATREQNAGLGQINQAVAYLDEATQQNAAMVEQSSAASASLHAQAERLQQLACAFKV